MKSSIFISVFSLLYSIESLAQIPLSKRDQEKKTLYEAQYKAEEDYKKTIKSADLAFRNKNYPEARQRYFEAIQYDKNQEQWLISKVNDLDILMAKNIARKVDSLQVMRMNAVATMDAPLPSKSSVDIAPRNDLPKTTIAEEKPAESIAIKQETATQEQSPVQVKPKAIEPVKEQIKPAEQPKEPEKVIEDFKAYNKGITEEDFDFPNHHVKRIVVKDGIDTIVYKYVTHQWGGKFYFKDDVSIVERIWQEEVSTFKEKYKK